MAAYRSGALGRDFVAVVRFQGPRANGMPELHQLTPALTSLQSQGHAVALVTDGRMSGASGAIPAAIHVTPECLHGGPLGRVRDGDVIRLDSYAGVLEACVSEEAWQRREIPKPALGRDARADRPGAVRDVLARWRRTPRLARSLACDVAGVSGPSVGGCAVLEITLRTPVALEVIAVMRAAVPEAIVGAGTLTGAEESGRRSGRGRSLA